MVDIVSILLIGGSFAVFYGIIVFCDRVVRDNGGKDK